jgi:hypothetical protein
MRTGLALGGGPDGAGPGVPSTRIIVAAAIPRREAPTNPFPGGSHVKTSAWLFAALALAAPAAAADLTKIERKLAREPVYQARSPKYCLLVFGLDMKARVWLVQDGDVLYVDRDGNGDLTGAAKRVKLERQSEGFRTFEVGDLRVGGLTHSGVSVTQMKARPESVGDDKEMARIKKATPEGWTWWVRVTAERPATDKRALPRKLSYLINGDSQGMLVFADRPEDAPVVHLNGPFSLALQDRKQRLIAEEKMMLQIGAGVPGVGPGSFAFVLYPNTIPKDAYPVAEVTFPPHKPGQKAVKRRYVLKERC